VVAGHSLGGLTALLVNQSDPHVNGAILLDPVLPEVLPGRSNKPILILGADRKEWTGSECSLWRNLQGPPAGGEFASDWARRVVRLDLVGKGSGANRADGSTKDDVCRAGLVAAFLDRTLREEPADPLLSGGSPNYPDAKVTLQDQALCGKQ
jgi:hypothetical protein